MPLLRRISDLSGFLIVFAAPAKGRLATTADSGGGTPPGSAAQIDRGVSDFTLGIR